jgi:NADH:ubiquinone oxidoreductase subunit E
VIRLTGLPAAKVYGTATFYAQFRLQPVGKHIIRVCRGTACHVRGSDRILENLQEHLQVAPGQTTREGLFTLETVACFGSCALAPIMVEEMFRVIREINQRGVTVLLVEQNTENALELAHRGYVLESGRVVLEGSGRELLANARVREAYLGL